MLAIRLQRTGRSGHAQYRVIVQDSHRAPTSGKVVKYLGSYNPHTKKAELKKEVAEFYLTNGAQPSERVARLFKTEGIKLPDWVKISDPKERTTRNPEKLRKNQPAEEAAPEAPVAEEAPAEEVADAPKEEATEEVAAEVSEAPEEKPAETA